LRLRPGITDPASIRFRNEASLLGQSEDPERTYVERILPEKLKLARDYARNASASWDLRLVLTTLAGLFSPARALESIVDRLAPYRFALGLALQSAAVLAANAFALLIRFDGHVPAAELATFLRVLPLVFVARLLWLHAFRQFHGAWRY